MLFKNSSGISGNLSIAIKNYNMKFIKSCSSCRSIIRSSWSVSNNIPLNTCYTSSNTNITCWSCKSLLIKPICFCINTCVYTSFSGIVDNCDVIFCTKLVDSVLLIINSSLCSCSRNMRYDFDVCLCSLNLSNDSFQNSVKGCSCTNTRKNAVNCLRYTKSYRGNSCSRKFQDLICLTIKNGNSNSVCPRTGIFASDNYIRNDILVIT